MDDVVYTRLYIQLTDFPRQNTNFGKPQPLTPYIAEIWITADGNYLRYQLTSARSGKLHYLAQQENDIFRQSSYEVSSDRSAIDQVTQFPIDILIEQLENNIVSAPSSRFLSGVDILDSIFNFNHLLSPNRQVCRTIQCLLELGADDAYEVVFVGEETPENQIDSYIFEIYLKDLEIFGPRAFIKIDKENLEFIEITTGYGGDQIPFEINSSAVIEERKILPPSEIPETLFTNVPDGIEIIDWLATDLSERDIRDSLWVISVTPEPGTTLGSQDNVWFEMEIGYRLVSVTKAKLSVILNKDTSSEIVDSWFEECELGFPGNWTSAGSHPGVSITNGDGVAKIRISVTRHNLEILGPGDVYLQAGIYRHVGMGGYYPVVFEDFPDFTWHVDVPPISERKCPKVPIGQ